MTEQEKILAAEKQVLQQLLQQANAEKEALQAQLTFFHAELQAALAELTELIRRST